LIFNNTKNLLEALNTSRNNNKIGVISGSFDVLHEGHKFALDFCKSKVDKLVVLINSDESIRLYKGNERPILKLVERLNDLDVYDNELFICMFDDLIPNYFLEKIKPDVYFLSKDWIKNPVENPVLEKYNIELLEHPELTNISTTKLNPNFDKSIGAIFFDRDGTINKDVDYLHSIDKIEISSKNLKAISKLSELNYLNIIVSNQSGVGRGYFNEKSVEKINDKIINIIIDNNGQIDNIYFDTSTPENPSKNRKPNIGMILQARADYNISLKNSWVIGDKDTDIELGKKCNMKTIYIKNDKYRYKSDFKPDHIVKNLIEAYKIIKWS
tara:strand:- start:1032 stop:2012 length:981 start_codon:yes stop_codon:yes gene_type:complete